MVVIERVAILMGSPHSGIRHLVVGYVILRKDLINGSYTASSYIN